MITGKVVHCKKEAFDVDITRKSKWGNPFFLDDPKDEAAREEVVKQYREWVLKQPDLMLSLHELRGKTLGCWCSPRSCHGDILNYLANDTPGTLRLIIAGSRGFNDYDLLCEQADAMCRDYNDVIIIEGEARGADLLGRRYAEERGYTFIPMPAAWIDKDGKKDKGAGFKRNEFMARIANASLIFWDTVSNGSLDMAKRSQRHKLKTRVIIY